MKTMFNPMEMHEKIGQKVVTNHWLKLTQDNINLFAEATGDHQWIHTDPIRAAKGPYSTTIAHGYLILSLLPTLFDAAMGYSGVTRSVNYGLNRVRFLSPVAAGKSVRGIFELVAAEYPSAKAVQLTWQVTIDLEGSERAACVAEVIVRKYFD